MKDFFKEHDLIKIISIVILGTLVLTWIIPATDLTSGLGTTVNTRLGISDLFLSGVYTMNFFLQQIFFLVVIGLFYGIVSKIDGYKKLISNIAKKLKGKELYFVLITSLIVAGLTSILSNVYVLLFFVPLIVTIIFHLKLDKLTAFLVTFGAILIGVLGATYGTDGLTSFINYLNYFTKANLTDGILVRFGILILAYILYSYFSINHVKKVLSNKKFKSEMESDRFFVEEIKEKNVKTWPIIFSFVVIFIFLILGFINWTTFNIDIFKNFHEWLIGFKIGDFAIFSEILGSQISAFGEWNIHHLAIVAALMLIFIVIKYRKTAKDNITNAANGVKLISKPIAIMLFVYVIFTFMYWSPIVPTIVNWLEKGLSAFNPFVTTLSAAISGFFHNDFGYTAYAVGTGFANYATKEVTTAVTIYSSMNGIISFIAPTSAILMIGLAYLEIPYKTWIKYIWKFIVGMIVCLLVIFALMTYM